MSTKQKTECVLEAQRHDMRDLTADEFTKIVFAGAGTNELRGPSDAFTVDEMMTIALSDAFKYWPDADKTWLRSGLDTPPERVGAIVNVMPRMESSYAGLSAALKLLVLLLTLTYGRLLAGPTQAVEVQDSKGKMVLTISQNKAGGINVKDPKGVTVATGSQSKRDTVLRDRKGNVIATIKEVAK